MQYLGFQIEVTKKGYYIDGHEKLAAIEYNYQFCKWWIISINAVPTAGSKYN
jgi:hypothetical protein